MEVQKSHNNEKNVKGEDEEDLGIIRRKSRPAVIEKDDDEESEVQRKSRIQRKRKLEEDED